MKSFSRFAVIVGIVCTFATSTRAEEPFRDLNFDEACKAAKKEKKVVMIVLHITWWEPCKMMDRTTWKDAKVQAWLKDNAVPIKVNAEKELELSEKYHVTAYPTILFLKPNGKKIDRFVGYRKAEVFLGEAKFALAVKTPVMLAKAALRGHETDPVKRMTYADALAKKGRNEEALKEYLWCFDHGEEHSRSFSGVRASVLVNAMASMTQPYAPAIQALKTRRDAARKEVLSAPPRPTLKSDGLFGWLKRARVNPMEYFYAAQTLSTMNRNLGQNRDTFKVYDQLLKKGEGYDYLRKAMFYNLLDLLLEARRYDDIVDGSDDILKWVDSQVKSSRRDTAMFSNHPGMPKIFKRSTITRIGKRYEAFLGVGQRKVAQEMAERLIKFDPSSETYVTLIEHAIRAGDKAAAQALAKEGLKALPEEDREAVRTAVAEFDDESPNAP